MNILELLKPSNKTALIQGNKRVTYSELLDGGLKFGGRLRNEGIGAGSHILIFIPLSIELYTAMIGAWSIGASAIFIDYSRGSKFVSDSLNRLRPDVIVCDNITSFVRNMYSKMRRFKTVNIKGRCKPVDTEKVDAEHPAILTFTSGTTGVPKVAVRTHGFLINQYNVLCKHVDFNENHIDLGTLPVFTLANLAANMTTLLPDKSYKSKINAKKLAARMEKEGITRAICSPAFMANLLQYSKFPHIKNMYLGGGPVYPSLLDRVSTDVDLHIVYGSTEAEPIASVRWAEVTREERRQIAHGAGLLVGHVVPEVECMIGKDNEILVSGGTVLKGYLDGIGDKENKIHDGDKIWHRTGDAGHLDSNGRLWLLGRVNQVIHDDNGILYPFCVECIIDEHYGIRGAIVTQGKNRIAVIEKGAVDWEDVLCELRPLHVTDVIEVKKIPMDKRHGAKVDYEKLKSMIVDVAPDL